MKKNFKSSGYAKRQSADIRRQDKSAGTDNHRIVKHRGRKMFVCPGAQDTLATPTRTLLTRTPTRTYSVRRRVRTAYADAYAALPPAQRGK